jgi:hypothetical protein
MNYLFLILAIVAALAFYSFLGQRRPRAFLVYGLAEIISGFGIIVFTLFPPAPGMLTAENVALKALFTVAGVSAGVYMMVRGLNDVRQGLPARHREKWDAFFGFSPTN